MLYFTFNTTVELLCLLVALVCLWGDKRLVWRSLILYLLIICIAEFTGAYLKKQHQPNQWVYNVLLIFQVGFTPVVFNSFFSRYIKTKLPLLAGVTVLLALYGYDLADHGFFRFNMITYNTMSVIYVLYSLYYFYLLLNDEEYVALPYSANFWWVAGVLFFYFGSTTVNLFREKIAPFNIAGHNLSYYIYIVLNIILYGCWCYSFICKKWIKTTSRASL